MEEKSIIYKQSLNKKLKTQKSSTDYTFFENVFDVVRKIPKGKVCTYGLIANYIGSKGSSRMVGWAMNLSHSVKPKVPAHRVVNRNGLLTGKHHFENENAMQQALEKEGIKVKDDKIIDFAKKLWDPNLELI